MLFDLEKSSSPHAFSVDVCVIGAGPAGITIATELQNSGLEVCLAEAGGYHEEEQTHAMYEGESEGHPMALHEGRHRVFGGAAIKWGGRCALLDEIDFERRAWVPQSGWPITRGALLPYYERAKVVGNFPTPWLPNSDGLKSINRRLPVFEGEDVTPFVWRAASRDKPRRLKTHFYLGKQPKFNWAEAYGAALTRSRDVFVVLHANLVSAHLDDAAHSLSSAIFKSLNGNTLEVKAKYFVMCCGRHRKRASGVKLLQGHSRPPQSLRQYGKVFRAASPRPSDDDENDASPGAALSAHVQYILSPSSLSRRI